MPTPRKDFKEILGSMGKKSASEFVKASGRSDSMSRAIKKVSLKDAFPGEARMDKLKARVGSDNRKVNYKAMYRSMKKNDSK